MFVVKEVKRSDQSKVDFSGRGNRICGKEELGVLVFTAVWSSLWLQQVGAALVVGAGFSLRWFLLL